MPAVKAERLAKHYGGFPAVDGIDFEVRERECFGFLGPNGAGKTSTMKMIYGRTSVSDGRLFVLGLDVARHPQEVKARVGVAAQEDNLDPDITVWENLFIYGRFYGLGRAAARARADELVEFAQLQEKSDSLVLHLSGGMKRRLVIARSLVNRPGLLILDEPTTGLDPRARHLVWQQLAALREQGVTLILTTHYMEEAQRLCDRLVVMDHGRILAEGVPDRIIETTVGSHVLEVPALEAQRVRASLGTILEREVRIGELVFFYHRQPDQVLNRLSREDGRIRHLKTRPTTLEDVFLTLTGRGLENGESKGDHDAAAG